MNLTNGRASRTRFRFIRLDPEERFVVSGQRLMLHVFDERTKAEGYGFLLLGAGLPMQLVKEGFAYTASPQKAKDAERLLFVKENFQTFPDLLYSDFTLQKPKKSEQRQPEASGLPLGQHRAVRVDFIGWPALAGATGEARRLRPKEAVPDDSEFLRAE